MKLLLILLFTVILTISSILAEDYTDEEHEAWEDFKVMLYITSSKLLEKASFSDLSDKFLTHMTFFYTLDKIW